ncbi:MAG: 4Fe-4S binding protein [Candidatus Omnitrophica bacterium]|nr:4Fe-4S binding protein [Candidatus Omnitrophota bacterium]
MGILIDKDKCDGCGACERICPGDLMVVDKKSKKAEIRSQEDCWDCMSCVKACPKSALETKLSFQFADFGAGLKPKISEDKIVWTAVDIDGKKEEFEIKTKKI